VSYDFCSLLQEGEKFDQYLQHKQLRKYCAPESPDYDAADDGSPTFQFDAQAYGTKANDRRCEGTKKALMPQRPAVIVYDADF
jgi:hypothetical protein